MSCDDDILFLFGIQFKDYFNGLLGLVRDLEVHMAKRRRIEAGVKAKVFDFHFPFLLGLSPRLVADRLPLPPNHSTLVKSTDGSPQRSVKGEETGRGSINAPLPMV